MNDYKFYISADGDILVKAYDPGSGATMATGLEMIFPKTDAEGAAKHLPMVSVEEGVLTAKVGEVTHPQGEEHHIAFIALVTTAGCQIANLSFDSEPQASFILGDAVPLKVYEYCNKHGLWMKNL